MAERSQLSLAIDLVQKANQEEDRELRIATAKEALELSSDCVEAWLLLAQEASGFLEAKEFLEAGVKAGDRLFANEREEWKGHFWNHSQTHPYLYARSELAQVMWELEDYEQAVDILKESLELNPADQQGLRYIQIKALLDLERYEVAQDLIVQYEKEESTIMLYARLLVSYKLYSDSPLSRTAFIEAKKRNPHVLDYLLKLRIMPKSLPKQAVPGTESEAIRYAAVFLDTWENAQGAVDFLRAQKKIRQYKESQSREKRKKR